jgi:hypothetical protein
MGLISFISGITLGIGIGFVLVFAYIVYTFGWDFIPILLSIMDGNVSFEDMMGLGRYFGYL